MRLDRKTIHAILAVAALALLVRPHRLWSSVRPELDAAGAGRALAGLADPSRPPLDEATGAQVVDAVYATRGYRHRAGQVARGENLGGLLQEAGASPQEAAAFCEALRPVFDPRRARDGDAYEILVNPEGRVEAFRYEVSLAEVYEARAEPAGWSVRRLDIPVERREEAISGRLSDSLYASFLGAGGNPELVMEFVELFAWDIDFAKEAQPGDEFRVVFERLYAQGRPFANGRILAASFRDSDEEHLALYYKSPSIEGYFDDKGQNVKKSFLRSPLKFSHISSGYSLARRHPVLDVTRPHRGVDYAAPSGTPVRSVADGRVVEAGWKGGAGINVTVRHARGYESYYNHLSRLPKGLKRGRAVEQGDLIGYVGSTGLSTGPHLDFRIRKGGQWVNPLKEKYLGGPPIPGREAAAFRAFAQAWVHRLGELAEPVAVAQR